MRIKIMGRPDMRLAHLIVYMVLALPMLGQSDSLPGHLLREVSVNTQRTKTPLKGSVTRELTWDLRMMEDLPKILGNADPIHYTQLLPGVQTNSEFDAGIHIQGCDNGHNLVSLCGVPVYNPAHLLGFFSVFNASHFSTMQLAHHAPSAASGNYLGGFMDMRLHDTIPQRWCGEGSVGLISSQGTIRIPLSPKVSLSVSARRAYLNLLYSGWLKFNEDEVAYSFSDYNASLLITPTARDKVWVDFYGGHDNVGLNTGAYQVESDLKWKNLMAAVHWQRQWRADRVWTQSLYTTYYDCGMHLEQNALKASLESSILDVGFRSKLEWGHWKMGADAVWHRVQPQKPAFEGSFNVSLAEQPVQQSLETNLWTDYALLEKRHWRADVGLRGSVFAVGDGAVYPSLSPRATCTYGHHSLGTVRLEYALKHQYLFRTGFSAVGLPSDFWMSASRDFSPAWAHLLSLSYEKRLWGGRWELSAQVYYKCLKNQLEYKNTILDILNTAYDLNSQLMKGRGRAYGVNVMLNKRTGVLTGWVSYSYGRSLRRFEDPDYPDEYPANHERLHELDGVLTCHLGKHWSVGLTGVYASGTPFTAPTHFYLMNERIVSEFGTYNANRLGDLFRMDVSVNYQFPSRGRFESGLNLSIYNVTNHSNDVAHRLSFYNDKSHGKQYFYYDAVQFAIKILPSLSYYVKF